MYLKGTIQASWKATQNALVAKSKYSRHLSRVRTNKRYVFVVDFCAKNWPHFDAKMLWIMNMLKGPSELEFKKFESFH